MSVMACDTKYERRAELRANAEGVRLQRDAPLHWLAASSSGRSYLVRAYFHSNGGFHVTCNCRSGMVRHQMRVPCKHAAVACQQMEREHILLFENGLWTTNPKKAMKLAK